MERVLGVLRWLLNRAFQITGLRPEMLDEILSRISGPRTPAVCTDGSSVVTTREISGIKAKSLSMKIETAGDPGSGSSGKVDGQVPQAHYTASGASVICDDKISDINVEGDIDLSVCVKPSRDSSKQVDTAEETLPSTKDPAVKMITEHKIELIDCLMADPSFILQHVHAKHIITDREYQNMKHISQPEETITDLIDQMIFKGQESCSLFLEVLKEPGVLMTYPQLKQSTIK